MENKQNFYGIDVIKVVAIISVICVHFLLNTEYYSTAITGKSLISQTFYRQIFIVCVPLFLLATGYLQWSKTYNKKYVKGLSTILFVYFVYSMLSIFLRIGNGETKTITEWIQTIFTFNANGYSWYVEMYIGLALLIPFLNLIGQGIKTKKEFHILLFVLILMTSLPNFWNKVNNDIPFLSILEFPTFWVEFYPILFYFVGVYIRKYQVKVPRVWAFSIFLLLTIIETVLLYIGAEHGNFVKNIGGYASLPILIKSTFLFLLLYDLNEPKGKINSFISPLLKSISVLTLDIYLASYITDQWIYAYYFDHWFTTQNYAIVHAPLIVVATFTLAYTISLIRSKLLKFKKTS